MVKVGGFCEKFIKSSKNGENVLLLIYYKIPKYFEKNTKKKQ